MDAGVVLQILFPVFVLILIGYFYGRRYNPELVSANQLNMRLFVPALVFDSLTEANFEATNLVNLVIAALFVVIGSGLLAWPIARFFKYPLPIFIPPMMFNNCGNMGLPVALLAFGESGLQIALVLFLVSNTLHFTLGVRLVGGKMSFNGVFFNAVNVAMVAGIAVNLLQLPLPETIALPIKMLGQIAIPLMLVSLGVRMVGVNLETISTGLVGALVRPLVGVLSAVLVVTWLPLSSLEVQSVILFAALPPAVLNYLFAEQFGQSPQQVAAIVIAGNAIAVAVLYITLLFIL
ncbi:MAG: putative permease [Saprospiraceae bacterium]|jgi:predicted permease